MKYPVKIEYALIRKGNRAVLKSDYESFVKATEINSRSTARSSIFRGPMITPEILYQLKQEAKEAVLVKVQEYVEAKEKVALKDQILATEEFELEI